jgi:hypothetical protein
MAYGRDVLDGFTTKAAPPPEVAVRVGDVIEHRASDFCGSIVAITNSMVRLRGRGDVEREFLRKPGAFLVEGKPATIVVRTVLKPMQPSMTRSGSVHVASDARVAVGSRLLVEGIHDAELVEHVWGDDLRHEGIVVERLDGADHLTDWLDDFRPTDSRRVGVLLDHLVAGSKESRLAATITDPNVMICGTPYVDIWQAIRPQRVGLEAWPEIPRSMDWKTGICRVFNEPEPGRLWKKLLGQVRSYRDLEAGLVGPVEQLIDFVCAAEWV